MMRPVIIGGGIAGLTTALALAERGIEVTLLSPDKLGADYSSSSVMAQGGVAAAVGRGDTVEAHAADTMAAGAGLCVWDVVRRITGDGPTVIDWLESHGVQFDHDPDGERALGLEAAHSQHRIVHAGGGGTGGVIIRALVEKVLKTPLIHVVNDAMVTDFLVEKSHVQGISVMHKGGAQAVIQTDYAVLATGGAGALWEYTTNPDGSWGSGLALAVRAGALLADLEFMQFHPTAIVTSSVDGKPHRMPLASEALRGEGAYLVNENGRRFMDEDRARWPKAELEPRDVVTRAIWEQLGKGHKVYLDVSRLDFQKDFPAIYNLCVESGVDTARIPVRPAAHYHMGGIATNEHGAVRGVEGLWAVGEVASTGLQGANRLASNSLLEGVSMGLRAATDIADRPVNDNRAEAKIGPSAPVVSSPSPELRHIMSEYVGVLRDREGLIAALDQLVPQGKKLADLSGPALAAAMVTLFALQREESRGAQYRTDFPNLSPLWERNQEMSLTEMECVLAALRTPVRHDPANAPAPARAQA